MSIGKLNRFFYATSCVSSTAEAINAMTDNAHEVSYSTLRRHCNDLDDWAKSLGYDIGNERGGLRLKNDWAVSYFRSRYHGKRCYYIVHSAIEHIWTEEL